MKLPPSILFALFLAAAPLFARDKADVLVMNNGDRFTCEIKGLDAGVLYVDFDYIDGTTHVDWSKVHHVESKQLFLFELQDGRRYVGALSMETTGASRPLRIQIPENAGQPVMVSKSDVVELSQTSDNFWRRFNGAINSGATFSKANESTQYNLGANVQYLRQNWSTGAAFNSMLTANTGVPTSTHNDLTAYYRRVMRWRTWFYTGLGSLLQSSEQDIHLQGNVGAGIGRYLKNTNRATLTVFGGLAYQNTRYSPSETLPHAQNIAAAMAGSELSIFKFSKTNLSVSAITFPALNQAGRVFSSVNSTYYVKFWRDISWNTSFYGTWDNQPPASFSGSDFGMSSGLGWSFGNYNGFSR